MRNEYRLFFRKLVWIIILYLAMSAYCYGISIWDKPAKIGYWFYFDHIFQEKNNKNVRNNKSKCLRRETWSIKCGFVDPTKLGLNKKQAFAFEQKEYKELWRDFSMNPHDYSSVLHWQRFNYWAIRQAIAAAYSAEFTIAQHPELDSTIANPFSQFANFLVKNRNAALQKDLLRMLSKTSLLVFFTRSNCNFCSVQSEIVYQLGQRTGIPVWNASLDTNHLPIFNHYMLAPDTLIPAQYLHVTFVPTLFLYLPPMAKQGSQEHWIRLATGLTSADLIEERILRFVRSYRHALLY